MVLKNEDGTYLFQNGVTAKMINGKLKIINKQTGGRVSMPSQYFGDINSIYNDASVSNDVVDMNNQLPTSDLARNALPSTFKGGEYELASEDSAGSSSFHSNFDEQSQNQKKDIKKNDNKKGGDYSKLNFIYDPNTNIKYSIFSKMGKTILKNYVNLF